MYLSLCLSTVTFPLDITKTRLQIQGQRLSSSGAKSHGSKERVAYRGMLRTMLGIREYI